jgi:hypothetical protein
MRDDQRLVHDATAVADLLHLGVEEQVRVIFPDDRSLIRLAGMLCIEQNDEWLVGRGYLSAESIALVCSPELAMPTPQEGMEEGVAELQAA